MSSSNQEKQETVSLQVWMNDNMDVLVKLIVFTAALFAFPILTFFLTLHSLFEGNTTYAAGAAAAMANLIVALYIITAMLEKPNTADKPKTQ
ncbi:Vacuolar ATPase assembly integral membrane protein vma-21 [Choanephora cucurbitarum]|uniref:Vacuolar ATPase assembly integral membrane protein vma-21 n=1 Tax=Choanephora cucurbitarum TaxID=101091 RepID=A0A1C7NN59_9FUNG|nr:Vacuolar ATPase assembly integral membrane protein vma-21 [Choanephora cucurbitarum]